VKSGAHGNDPHHWIIDPEAAQVIKRIFTMCMEGRGPSQIANQLRADQVLTPYALRELIQGIYVEAPDKSTGKRRQTIHIKYDGIGFIPLDVLMNGKTA